MRKIFLFLLTLSITTAWSCKQTTRQKSTEESFRFEADWESLKQYEVPEWFLDAKFGIYTHWGAYSVPSYENEWYPRLMYMKDDEGRGKEFYEYHKKIWGDPSKFGYKDFIPLFKADNFDADEWADIFKRSGAQFAGPVAEHHDGFAMWDSDLTRWDARDMGPGHGNDLVKAQPYRPVDLSLKPGIKVNLLPGTSVLRPKKMLPISLHLDGRKKGQSGWKA